MAVPTQIYQLPSKGLPYPKDHPLKKSEGKIELKYLTAVEEDIITNEHYIQEGVMYDKLIDSILVDKSFPYEDLLVADFNSLVYPIRVLSYGNEVTFVHDGTKYNVDISNFEHKKLDPEKYPNGNYFELDLPNSDNEVSIKLPTIRDEKKINAELASLKKSNPKGNFNNQVYLSHLITSINGSKKLEEIKEFIGQLLSADARFIRTEIENLSPLVLATFKDKGGRQVVVPPAAFRVYPDNTF